MAKLKIKAFQKKQNKTKTRTNSQEQAILKKKYFMAGMTEFPLSQQTHLILLMRGKFHWPIQDVSSLALYHKRIPNHTFKLPSDNNDPNPLQTPTCCILDSINLSYKGKLSTFNSKNWKIVKKFTPYNDSRVQNLIFTIVNCDQCLKNPILVSKLSLIIITPFQIQKFYNISFFFVSLYFPTNYRTI